MSKAKGWLVKGQPPAKPKTTRDGQGRSSRPRRRGRKPLRGQGR